MGASSKAKLNHAKLIEGAVISGGLVSCLEPNQRLMAHGGGSGGGEQVTGEGRGQHSCSTPIAY